MRTAVKPGKKASLKARRTRRAPSDKKPWLTSQRPVPPPFSSSVVPAHAQVGARAPASGRFFLCPSSDPEDLRTRHPASRSRGATDESPDLRTRSDRWHLTRPRHPRPSLRARSLATTRTPPNVLPVARQNFAPKKRRRLTLSDPAASENFGSLLKNAGSF